MTPGRVATDERVKVVDMHPNVESLHMQVCFQSVLDKVDHVVHPSDVKRVERVFLLPNANYYETVAGDPLQHVRVPESGNETC